MKYASAAILKRIQRSCLSENKIKMDKPEDIKLTQFSRGAGCGCKIAPKVLDEILNI